MRITFKGGGGFAAVPGLAAPVTIDVQDLPPEDQAAIRELVKQSAFFTLPPRISAAGAGAADLRTYTITIDDGDRAHTVTLTDPVPAGHLGALVNRLSRHAAAARRSQRGTDGHR